MKSRRGLLASTVGLLMTPFASSAGETIYRYDALGRLSGARHSNGTSTLYAYDAAGNRTAKRSGTDVLPNAFDANFYRLTYPDIFNAQMSVANAHAHYQAHGRFEGRDPNAYFSTVGYLAAYPDVASASNNPLEHYSAWGWREGRDPSPKFGTLAYLQYNPDVATAGVNPLEHYLTHGIYEGREPRGTGGYHPPQ